MQINRIIGIITISVLASAPFATAQSSQDKLPVPEDAVQKQAASLISNLFKNDFDAAKTAEKRSQLAKKMLQVGMDSKDDATGRYVLLRNARDVAADVGNIETAMAAIEQLGIHYDVDVLEMNAEVLAKVVKALRTPKDHQELSPRLQEAISDAVSQDRFDVAKSINAVALDSARQARSVDLVKQVVATGKDIEELEVKFQEVQSAMTTLKTSPTDPEANLLVGQYQCFVKRDWENGLLMLALGSDTKLKKLATAELNEERDALLLGNAWWEYSEEAKGKAKAAAQSRAAGWYKQVTPLEGLTKKLVESRLAEVSELGIEPSLLSSTTVEVSYSDPRGFGGVDQMQDGATVAVGRSFVFTNVPDGLKGLNFLKSDVTFPSLFDLTVTVPAGTELWLLVDKVKPWQENFNMLATNGWKAVGTISMRVNLRDSQLFVFNKKFTKSESFVVEGRRFESLHHVVTAKPIRVFDKSEYPLNC